MFKRTVLPAIATALVLSSASFAQTAPGADAPPSPQTEMQTGVRGGGMAARLTRLHDRIGITAAQQPQWDAVVATLRESARAMRPDPGRRASRDGLPMPQQLRAAADAARQRADAVQRLSPPGDALYAALSPDQQHIADQEIRSLMHGRGRRG